MKIALLNDTHFSARNFNRTIANNQLEFFENQFFPYLRENDIKNIIHLGDIFDNRDKLDIKMIDTFKKRFFDVLHEMGVKLTIIIGNHDITYRHSNTINTPQAVLREYDNITIIPEAEDIEIGGVKICCIPWVNNENVESTIEHIKNTNAPYLFGHLELAGFRFQKNGDVSTNEPPIQKYLDKFDLVLSGHYHTKTRNGNIIYLGSQYEMTWADAGDEKGFNVFDTKDGSLEYIPNPNTLFNVIHYNESTTIEDIDPSKISGKFVKLIVDSKKTSATLDLYVQHLLLLNPSDIKIEDNTLFINPNAESSEININDTRSMLMTYIDMIEYSNKDELKKLLMETYDECYDISWNGREGE